jgi:cytoskeleton protein RodZ
MTQPASASADPGGAAWYKRLREQRERRGLNRHQVAEDLHVDEQTIAALEAGRFTSLGAPVFARGHLRKYATVLGLNADELLTEFERDSAQPPDLVPLTPSAPRLRPEVPVKWLGAATVAAMVLGVAWWALTQPETPLVSQPPQVPPELAPPPAEPVKEPVNVAAQPVQPVEVAQQPATDAAPVPAAAEQVTEPAVQGTPVRLQLSFSADSWVELYDASGQRVFFDLGSANSVRSLTAAAPLKVFFGFADGVQLELNGEPVVVPAQMRHGNVARFTVDERGQVRRPAG